MFGRLIAVAVVNILTFVFITGWMVEIGVDSTVASVIGAAAVFGELALVVKVHLFL